jgi:hypothetical protein
VPQIGHEGGNGLLYSISYWIDVKSMLKQDKKMIWLGHQVFQFYSNTKNKISKPKRLDLIFHLQMV